MEKDQRKVLPPITPYSDFCYQLNSLPWSFTADNFEAFVSRKRIEDEFYRMAYRGGPYYIRAYHHSIKEKMYQIARVQIDKIHEDHRIEITKLLKTGDDEFDEFAKQVRNHDWFYNYSDDIKVWRNGEEREKKLYAIAKEKGGIYLTYWQHIATTDGQRTPKVIPETKPVED